MCTDHKGTPHGINHYSAAKATASKKSTLPSVNLSFVIIQDVNPHLWAPSEGQVNLAPPPQIRWLASQQFK